MHAELCHSPSLSELTRSTVMGLESLCTASMSSLLLLFRRRHRFLGPSHDGFPSSCGAGSPSRTPCRATHKPQRNGDGCGSVAMHGILPSFSLVSRTVVTVRKTIFPAWPRGMKLLSRRPAETLVTWPSSLATALATL